MTVVIFPGNHAGERQPSAFTVRLPQLRNEPVTSVYVGVDGETQAAVTAEIETLTAAIRAAEASTDRLVALLEPFVAEGTR